MYLRNSKRKDGYRVHHSPITHNSWSWAKLKSGAANSIQLSYVGETSLTNRRHTPGLHILLG